MNCFVNARSSRQRGAIIQRRLVFRGSAGICAVILLLGCSARHADLHVEKESSIYNMTRFIQGIHAFPYDAPADRSQRLIQSIPLIIKGMMKTEIETMLGKPDGEILEYDESKGVTFEGSRWAYVIHIEDASREDIVRDRGLCIYFDSSDRVWGMRKVNLGDAGRPGSFRTTR